MNDYQQKTNQDLEKVFQLIQNAPAAPKSIFAKLPRRRLLIGAGLCALIAAIGGTLYSLTPRCDVKAVVRDGSRYYYAPTDPYYKQVKVKDDTGDRYFCTEQEALSNGWVKKQYDSKKPHKSE